VIFCFHLKNQNQQSFTKGMTAPQPSEPAGEHYMGSRWTDGAAELKRESIAKLKQTDFKKINQLIAEAWQSERSEGSCHTGQNRLP
jgi:hypothetical protein